MKKVFKLVTKSSKDASQDVTMTTTVNSKENNEALENLNNKLSDVMKDRGVLAFYLLFLWSKITISEHTSQYNLKKETDLKRVNDLLINKTVPVTL